MVIVAAMLLHAALPRYEVVTMQPSAPDYPGGYARFDRWTGRLDAVGYTETAPDWYTVNGTSMENYIREYDAEQRGRQQTK
jgi:hypothetical protein